MTAPAKMATFRRGVHSETGELCLWVECEGQTAALVRVSPDARVPKEVFDRWCDEVMDLVGAPS